MKYFIPFLVVVILGLFSCSSPIATTTNISYLSSENGVIMLRASGIGRDIEDATSDAEIKALDMLLFRGIPNSEQKLPVIGSDELGIKNKSQSYFQKFYQEGRYRTFLISSHPVTPLVKLNQGGKSITIDVQINVPALRRDLEEFNIVHKFGY